MNEEAAAQVRRHLGGWSGAEKMTDRRGAQVWRVRLAGGGVVAVKIAESGPVGCLPAREAAVIRAAGSVAGTVLAAGRLTCGGSWMAAPWWDGPSLWARYQAVRRTPQDAGARHTALRAAAEAAHAVAGLHMAGWAHGDIQADHVVHTAQSARLLDLAWAHHPHHPTAYGAGAPYAGALVHLEAPETARRLLDGASATPSPEADVYALGGALWSCWTGEWPVDYEAAGVDPAPGNLEAKRRAVASGAWLRSASSTGWEGFAALLRAALSFRPEDRPAAGALAGEFRRLSKRKAAG